MLGMERLDLTLTLCEQGQHSVAHDLVFAGGQRQQRKDPFADRLLAFSRKQTLIPQVILASDLVDGMTDLLRRTLEESIDIEFVSAGKDLWRCEADPSQLENAILNLAINARDVMPGGGPSRRSCLFHFGRRACQCEQFGKAF